MSLRSFFTFLVFMNVVFQGSIFTRASEETTQQTAEDSLDIVEDVASFRQYALKHQGDSKEGRNVFESKIAACATCHFVGGTEQGLGPNLIGIADKYSRASLIDAVLDPSKTILPGYTAVTVLTDSGLSHTGIVVHRGEESVRLINAERKTIQILIEEIEEEISQELSLMPAGIHKNLSPQKFSDLIAYLQKLSQHATDANFGPGTPDIIPSIAHPISVQPIHEARLRFDRPVWMSSFPGSDNTFVILEHQSGKIWLLEKHEEGDRKLLFADLKDEISQGPVEGLMSIAFHPNFISNRRYFLKHETLQQNQRVTLVVERRASEDLRHDSQTPSRILIRVPQPADNHNGGTIRFGPDGYLYIAMGDGGPQRDPPGYAQDLNQLLGSLLRIDVDLTSENIPYGIPPSNPYVSSPDRPALPEIWATGFREPWRFSFDSLTGDLWIGDVGQDRFEEVCIVRKGENHGWNVFEGFAPFSDEYRKDGTVYVPPVVSLARKHGVSVTGGFVYRGDTKSSYYGVYIFGDYESQRIWGLKHDNRALTAIREIGHSPAKIASFGVDAFGEIYLVGYDGMIYQLDLKSSPFE